jgi:hypothetical protein
MKGLLFNALDFCLPLNTVLASERANMGRRLLYVMLGCLMQGRFTACSNEAIV